jgi:hypothetical protein
VKETNPGSAQHIPTQEKKTSQDTYIQEGISTQDKTTTYEQDNNAQDNNNNESNEKWQQSIYPQTKFAKSMKSRRKM